MHLMNIHSVSVVDGILRYMSDTHLVFRGHCLFSLLNPHDECQSSVVEIYTVSSNKADGTDLPNLGVGRPTAIFGSL